MPATFLFPHQNVVRPLDVRLQAGMRLDGAAERRSRRDRELGGFLRAQFRAQQEGKPKPSFRRRQPFPSQAPAPFRLRLSEDDNAFFDAVARELLDHVVGGGGFLEDADVAADDAGAGHAGNQIVGVQDIGSAEQAVAEVGAGWDVVAQRAEVLDVGPNRRAAHAQLLREFGARDRAVPRGSQGIQDLRVNTHGGRDSTQAGRDVSPKCPWRTPRRGAPA